MPMSDITGGLITENKFIEEVFVDLCLPIGLSVVVVSEGPYRIPSERVLCTYLMVRWLIIRQYPTS